MKLTMARKNVFHHEASSRSSTQKQVREMKIGRMMQIPLKNLMIIGKGWFSLFERDGRGSG